LSAAQLHLIGKNEPSVLTDAERLGAALPEATLILHFAEQPRRAR
jgi:hypothetical protein